jgi:hypothetical protein
VVNEAHFSALRLNNNLGIPRGGVGVTLADQGISDGPQGIKQGFPQYAGVEMLYFNSFTVGTNPFFVQQINNTFSVNDSISKVLGKHTIKAGGTYIWYKVKQLPDLVANGTFSFFGSGTQSTGNGFADFLLEVVPGLVDRSGSRSCALYPPVYRRSSDSFSVLLLSNP